MRRSRPRCHSLHKDWEGIAKLWDMHDQLLWLPRGAQRVASLTGPVLKQGSQPGPVNVERTFAPPRPSLHSSRSLSE
jgi:hypothetical protein